MAQHYNLPDGAHVYIYSLYASQLPTWYKIGYSSNLNTRFQTLQVSSPAPLHVALTIRTDKPRILERQIKGRLQTWRGLGEWFLLAPSQINDLRESWRPLVTAYHYTLPIYRPHVRQQVTSLQQTLLSSIAVR